LKKGGGGDIPATEVCKIIEELLHTNDSVVR